MKLAKMSIKHVLFVCMIVVLCNANGNQAVAQGSTFVIDASKPYVYLKVDHIGKREPRWDGEPNIGIWLWIRNNCKVPIVISTFGVPPGSPELESGVMDDVVADPEYSPTSVLSTSLGIEPPELPDMSALMNSVGPKDAVSAGATRKPEEKVPEMPTGYRWHVGSTATIPPGKGLLFSVPINHVGKRWHFEIPFRFALKNHGSIRAPYSYLAFYEEDIPHDMLPKK